MDSVTLPKAIDTFYREMNLYPFLDVSFLNTNQCTKLKCFLKQWLPKNPFLSERSLSCVS